MQSGEVSPPALAGGLTSKYEYQNADLDISQMMAMVVHWDYENWRCHSAVGLGALPALAV